MNKWQSIDTAPKDGTRFLAYGVHAFDSKPSLATVEWSKYLDGFICEPNEATEYDYQLSEITHWMPLPPCPAEK